MAPIIEGQLSRQKIRQKFSVIKTNSFDDVKKIAHFGILIHVLSWWQQKLEKTAKTQVFVMITEIFWRENWQSIIGAVENFR
jgi:hypothetical protein